VFTHNTPPRVIQMPLQWNQAEYAAHTPPLWCRLSHSELCSNSPVPPLVAVLKPDVHLPDHT